MKFIGCDIPVTCGGVRVIPGDLVMADIDGVIVVPKARIEAVLEEAKKVAEDDVWVLGQIKSGRTLAEIEREKPVP
jgi:regulator of RNase E activity RraA